MFKTDYEGLITTEHAVRLGGTMPLFTCEDSKLVYPEFSSQKAKKWYETFNPPYRVVILGLGDVGGTLATILKTMGSKSISEIGIYDLDENRMKRYYLELSQIYGLEVNDIPIVSKTNTTLFDTDVFIFTASAFVPSIDSKVKDVRMAQFEANVQILEAVVENAISSGFTGLFCIVSDPVDLLCKVVANKAKKMAYDNLSPIHIRGFGLGVMHARARYYATKMGIDYSVKGAAYGPHGRDLIILNDVGKGFDLTLSKALTKKTVEANLVVRALGFKPYIAPAVSSGALSIIALLEGRWHHSAIPFMGTYFGIKNRMSPVGIEIESIAYRSEIDAWFNDTIDHLEKSYATVYTG